MAVSGAEQPAGIFISYRRADASWPVRWLADRLAGQLGAGVVFQDVDSIRPGDDFAAEIEAAVGACSVLLAVIGPRWLTAEGDAGRRLDDPRDWVRLEIEAAIKREVRVIPVLVDDARMPAADELPPSLKGLARRQAVSLSPDSLDIRRLVSVLGAALGREEKKEAIRTGTQASASAHPDRAWTGRLLTSAVYGAFALMGRQKADALAAGIRAAAVVAPERVEWLAGEAEAAVRSIEEAPSQAYALAGIAEAVAAADPDRAMRLARQADTIYSPVSWGLSALTGVAAAVAATDPDRAEAIARSIKHANSRSSALRRVAIAVAVADPDRAVRLASEANYSYSPGRRNRRGYKQFGLSAVAEIAAEVAVADSERAETIARSIEDASSRSYALAGIAAAVAATDPERASWLALEAETTARSIEDVSYRSHALAGVAKAVAAADPGRAEVIVTSIEEAGWRWSPLAGVAAAMAATDPERAEGIARSIENASARSSALANLVWHLAQQKQYPN